MELQKPKVLIRNLTGDICEFPCEQYQQVYFLINNYMEKQFIPYEQAKEFTDVDSGYLYFVDKSSITNEENIAL